MATSNLDNLLATLIILGTYHQVYTATDSSGLQAVIPDNLVDCYKNATLRTRENLPPMTLNVLLSILRKLEGLTGSYSDMRTFSSQVMNTYRIDGIERNPDVAQSPYVIPYGPSGNEFYRYKILMDGLISNSGSTFSNTSIRTEEKCAIHLMLSASVDRNERGDESTVCNSLTNYVRWDSRVPRDLRGYQEEVETVDTQAARYQGPAFGHWLEGGFTGLSCPLESGVVYTRYGAVKFGMVLGGIAAGLQSQSVTRNNLMLVAKANSIRKRPFKLPRLYSVDNSTQNISNIWAASLSGELAEVAILQGPLANSPIRVGLNGGWNDSVLPRYYFLQEDNKDAVTDTDIRGSIDGLILGTNAQSWNSQVGGSGYLKLSQLLDMYYSERGVLSSSVRACTRITHLTSNFSSDDMYQQSYAFSGVLEAELPNAVNVEDTGLQNFNYIAVQKFVNYIGSMTENQCSFNSTTYTSSQSSGIVTQIVSPAVHLYLVIDLNFDYLTAARIMSQIAERLEVSKFTGNISVINAKDASVLVNSTSDILDFYGNFTRDKYSKGQRGFDLARILKEVGGLLQVRLDLDSQLNTAGGPSSVVLIVPYNTATVSDSDSTYINKRLLELSQTVPDAKFMYLTTTAKERFTSFANSSDVFTLSTSDIPTSVDNVVSRLVYYPRRIINPTCASNFSSGTATSDLTLTAYIEPVGGVQYYRIHPNYFYKTSGGSISISSSSGSTLNICKSRINVNPSNNSQYDTCQQISSSTYTLSINNACGDSSITNCAPFYLSIAVVSTSSSTSTCTDDNCRYPDNIQVSITQNGLTCASGALESLRKINLILMLTVVLLHWMFSSSGSS